jgi:Phosphodiester glycosidase
VISSRSSEFSPRLRRRGARVGLGEARVLIGLLGALCLAVPPPAAAQDGTTSSWTALAPGLWFREWRIEAAAEEPDASGYAFRADPRVVHMTVLDARRVDRRIARVQALREESNAYLVVNGGFFDERGRPLGLVVGDGHITSPLRKVDQGVFLISSGKPLIRHASEPLPHPIEVALESGPRLVVDGRALQLKPQASRRTSVCLPGDGTVMIVVFPQPISLSNLAQHLVRPAADGGLGCWSALNLDGGPSTQLSVATSSLNLEVEGGWGVPNGLAVMPKTTAPPTPTR